MRIKCTDCGVVYGSDQDHSCKPIKVRKPIVYIAAKSITVRKLKTDPPPMAEVKLEDASKPKWNRTAYMKKYMVTWRKTDKARNAALKGEK